MRDIIADWAQGEAQPEGLTPEEISLVRSCFEEDMRIRLPEAVLRFLSEMNGLSFDGHVMYCCVNHVIRTRFPMRLSMDLLDVNTRFLQQTGLSEWLLLGHSDTGYLAFHLEEGRYVWLSNGVMRRMGEYGTLEEAMSRFLGLMEG